MVISRTPLRLSFIGGGSDFRAHFTKHGGAVLSAAIDKYIYVTVSPSFDGRVHLHYSRIEVVDHAEQLQHDIVRAALAQAGISRGIEIHTIADVTGEGTGLGSSSALAVGLVNALDVYLNPNKDRLSYERLGSMACEIEIEALGKPIGEQDQYIAAFGDLRLFQWEESGFFGHGGEYFSQEAKDALNSHVLLFDTRLKRNAHEVLAEQSTNVERNTQALKDLAGMAQSGYELLQEGKYSAFGVMMDWAWNLKRKLSSGISTPLIDSYYEHARIAGAWGGKICGAGGGGYLLLIAPPEAHVRIRSALALPEMRVRLGVEGSVVREI